MSRIYPWSFVMLALTCGVAFADPGITVTYLDGRMRVQLEGSYAGSRYTVWRSGERVGEYAPITDSNVLCTGDCFAIDLDAVPGRTYFYRFDLIVNDSQFVSYGPYAVTVPDTPLGARVSPNPGSGPMRVELSLPGHRRDAPVDVEARILDLQGRTVHVLHRGPLARGVTALTWNGRGNGGSELGAGLYFVRLSTPLGSSITRFVRIR